MGHRNARLTFRGRRLLVQQVVGLRHGNPHISYPRLDDTTRGTVRYATRTGEIWTIADLESLILTLISNAVGVRTHKLIAAADERAVEGRL